MARFNQAQSLAAMTVNQAGGEAFAKSPKLEVATLLLASFVQDQFYRSASDQLKRLVPLIQAAGPEFSAKAAVYARREFGMRSITHAMTAEVAKASHGEPWLKDFFAAVVQRPDDITEILSYYTARYGVGEPKRFRKAPRAFIRGLARSFARFDAYQLGKYRGEGKSLTMVDAVNLLHPVPTEQNRAAFEGLVKGTLKSTSTWESALTQAGQVQVEAPEQKVAAVAEAKKEAWADLLKNNKLGSLALLRNLRNILEQSPDSLPEALRQLQDPQAIRHGRIMPFQYATAYREFGDKPGKEGQEVLGALSNAATIACSNVPAYDGRCLVALDMSGSMGGKPFDVGSLFACVMVLAWKADLMLFSNAAEWAVLTPGTPLLVAHQALRSKFKGGGTNYQAIFKVNRPYDRIVILSDGEAWMGRVSANHHLKEYRAARYIVDGVESKVDPQVFWFDLAGGGTMQFPERNCYVVGGFSEKVFELMAKLGEDPQLLVKTIEELDFKKYLPK